VNADLSLLFFMENRQGTVGAWVKNHDDVLMTSDSLHWTNNATCFGFNKHSDWIRRVLVNSCELYSAYLLTTGIFIDSDIDQPFLYWCVSELGFQGFRRNRSYCIVITIVDYVHLLLFFYL